MTTQPTAEPRVVFTHRDDPLVPYLGRALRASFDVVAEVAVDISPVRRLVAAAVTLRFGRARWGERYMKSDLTMSGRSHWARTKMDRIDTEYDVVFQTHALYRVEDPRTVIYVDCTHRQSVDHWPAWNPLTGRALARWLRNERRQYHAAAHVFAFCTATRQVLLDYYGLPPDRVTVVGAGLDFAALPAVSKRDHDDPVVLFVGNDFERKGGPELLEAFARVREAVPGARLRIVGSGCPDVDEPGIEVLGAVNDRDRLSEIYAASTVFCLPSHFEPFGLVLLEAMAHGLPCVVTDSCGMPDVVVDGVTGSVLTDDEDLCDHLAAAVIGLLKDPGALREQGLAGRQRVEQHFLWSQVMERMRPVLRDVAAAHRNGLFDRLEPAEPFVTAPVAAIEQISSGSGPGAP